MIRALVATVLVAVLGLVGWRRYQNRPVPLDEVYPGVPWTHLVPQLAPVSGIDGLRAQDCGKCHERHYQEWRQSTHAHAYSDLQFQSELAKPTSPAWLCLNCHIPVENQRDELVRSLRGGRLYDPVRAPHASFDPVLRDEGVTCAACHVRKDEAGNSYILGSIALGDGGAHPPHPVRVDRQALVERCNDCHDQSYRLTPQLVCAFASGSELRAGPYAGNKQCVSCHMPEEIRPLVKGLQPLTAHGHSFVGGGVPKRFDLFDAGYRPAIDLEYQRDGWSISVALTNARAAHLAPTGDPERFYRVEAVLLDERGAVLGREQLRIGQIWEWEPTARRIFDNRIAPREERRWTANLHPGVSGRLGFLPRPESRIEERLPPLEGTPARIRIVLSHVRLTRENGDWMKQTAATADRRFAPAIAALDEHYPYERYLFWSEVDLTTGRRVTSTPEELVRRSKTR